MFTCSVILIIKQPTSYLDNCSIVKPPALEMNRSAPRNIAPVWSLGDMEFRPRIKKKHRPRKFTGYNINAPSPSKNPTYIGLLCAGTTNNVLPNEETCKATFIDQLDSDDFLLNLSYEECDVIVKIALDAEFLEGKCRKALLICFNVIFMCRAYIEQGVCFTI